jgi:pimeloyl-ACP methyl ester carboxylesterase
LAPPGRKYWVQSHGFQVHVACFGNASSTTPLVFLEGGERSVEYFSSWVAEAQDEGLIGQYCYWDRPGYNMPRIHLTGRYAFSDNAPSPMSAGAAIDVLQAAMPKANITEKDSPGWIFVSHGVGGLYSRVLAARHTSKVKGLLLVDTIPESLIPNVFTSGRTFILLLRGIISPLGIDRLSGWIFKHRSREDRVWGVSSWRSDRVIKSQFQESLAAGSITRNEVNAAQAAMPDTMPLAVVSSGKKCKDKEWEQGQQELSRNSKKSTWDVVGNAGHEVWRDEEGKKVLKRRLRDLVYAV